MRAICANIAPTTLAIMLGERGDRRRGKSWITASVKHGFVPRVRERQHLPEQSLRDQELTPLGVVSGKRQRPQLLRRGDDRAAPKPGLERPERVGACTPRPKRSSGPQSPASHIPSVIFCDRIPALVASRFADKTSDSVSVSGRESAADDRTALPPRAFVFRKTKKTKNKKHSERSGRILLVTREGRGINEI